MIIVDYTFYEEYMEDIVFKNIFESRLNKIQKDIQISYMPTSNLLEDYFVEIFSWTVLPRFLLYEIDLLVSSYIPNYVLIDPCSGNSFHTFLFHHFCNKKVITVDIQREESAWIDTIEYDGLKYINSMIEDFKDKVLLLAWIDYDDLTVSLLKSYKGGIVISIGNYDESNSKKYLAELSKNYKLIKHYELEMPWHSIEHIRIYEKKVYEIC